MRREPGLGSKGGVEIGGLLRRVHEGTPMEKNTDETPLGE